MKKSGKRTTDRMHKEVSVSNELRSDPSSGAIIEEALAFRQGATIERQNWRTMKVERWVLLSPRGPAEDFWGEFGNDWMSNRTTLRRRQRWEAAYVGSAR